MDTSSEMGSIFNCYQANYVGRLESSFIAEVWWTQENFFEESGQTTPYLRVMLVLDEGASFIDAIAFGNAYHVAKKFYKLGKVYCFPSGMFEIRPRTSRADSTSTYPFDLWFVNESDETRPTPSGTNFEESMQNMNIF
ncbi:uncharacterized protein LOC118438091 [Folsomia candida]|uniref:uncharacterized protein LOC118438091 n=1 Tax=Folsomia candida TaxID=158441 RepID=UPI0016052D1F|nr:uncharacterized protein LOC118438091 [Folsomia candida]